MCTRVAALAIAALLSFVTAAAGEGLPASPAPATIIVAAIDRGAPEGAPPVALMPVAVPPTAPAVLTEPFGRAAMAAGNGDVVSKWAGVAGKLRAEHAILAQCRDDMASCPASAQRFLAIVAEGRARSGRARIGIINRAVNLAIRPMSDLMQWGVIDRWSSPLETFATGRGDCEDYAIAKYAALKEAGVAAEDVRLVILRNTAIGEDHAAVAVRLDGVWLLLDNRWLTLVEADAMPGVAPLFVLDGDGVRRFAPAPLPLVSRGTPPAGNQGAAPVYLDSAS